jgi:rare lipoprotein A
VHADAPRAVWRGIAAVAAMSAAVGITLGCANAAGGPAARAPRPGTIQEGRASYYGKSFVGKRTASGERYDPNLMTAAHKTLPLGTRVRVTRVGGPSVVVRVNDRCGCTHGRIIDVSEAAARKLDMIRIGVIPVRLEILGRGPARADL